MPWGAAEPIAEQIVAALERVLAGAAADRELDVLLRANRELSAEGRAAAAESIFGVALWRRRLAWHVTDRTPDARMLWFALMRALAKDVWDDCKRIAGLPDLVVLRTGTPEELGVKWSAPPWLVETVERELGESAEKFFRTISVPGPIYVRANTLRVSREALIEKLGEEELIAKPSKYSANGVLLITDRPNLTGLRAKKEALFEVQDEGSQLLAQLVGAAAGETVVDYCAGAGGKTLALAGDVGLGGVVHAYDIDAPKLERLRVRAEQASASNVRIHHEPPAVQAQRVLVDAPCSEIGALRRGPDMRWRMKPELFPELPPLQLEILEEALRCVAPSGKLVYATCTIRREENEDVARAFEQKHPELQRVALPPWAKEFEHQGFFRALPHVHGTDGFFAVIWRR